MILIIDNYDSFVYNLACYVEKLGEKTDVRRNNKITIKEIEELAPEAIIISPGPKAPKDAGICIELIKELGAKIPILGVCLGHQAICEAYGGKTITAQKPMHGKSSNIIHDKSGLFHNLPSPLKVGRYHSLSSDLSGCDDLEITAKTESDEIMAVTHKKSPVFGLQFHPESILTPQGINLIENFIAYSKHWHKSNDKEGSNK